MSYDSNVYMAYVPAQKQKFFIDRYGYGFMLENGQVLEGENNFKYGVNVTGVVNYGGYLYVSTSKGEIKKCVIMKKSFDTNSQL